MAADDTLDAIESLIVWIRERPAMYCRTAGELDTTLHFLHLLWCRGNSREQEYESVVATTGSSMGLSSVAMGLIGDNESIEFLSQEGPARTKVLKYWSRVGEQLKLTAKLERL